jgi:uncharacterized protein YndB with AHSA1/START domain
MMEDRCVIVEREFAHPPAKLWRALTQPHLIEQWLMKNDFAATVGQRFQLRGDWGGTLDCEVLVVEADRVLSYTWNFDHDDPALRLRSTVTFILTPSPAGTRLRVEQAGFEPEQRRAFAGARAGWERFLARLEQVAERPL